MESATPSIKYCDVNIEVAATDPDKSVLEYSISNKIPHLHECGGHGLCTTCRIRVIDGVSNLNPPTRLEKDMAKRRGWDSSIRLACQTKVHGKVAVERLIWTNTEISNLQLETIPLGIGEERELVFLFCDMRNFTPFANSHPTFDVAHMLNRFFTILGDPVFLNNGIIYQYAGDEIIALFGTGTTDIEKMCLDATRAALGMTYALEWLNKWELKDFDTALDIGIGLHFGKAFVGNIGHTRHKQFAVIGDPVNVASRIQGKNKDFKTNILASEDFMKNLPDAMINSRLVSNTNLKGKEEKFPLYEIQGFIEPDTYFGVQATLSRLLENEESFAEKFYTKLFEKAPEVEALFNENMTTQGKMLTHMLRGIVYSLSRPEFLKLGLEFLGERHKGYGVEKHHYDLIKEILIESIEEELGEEYTKGIQKAWEDAVELITSVMNR